MAPKDNSITGGFWRLTIRREPAGLRELPADQRGELRAAQIHAIMALTPTMIAANLVNMLIVTLVFWGDGRRDFLSLWSIALALILAAWWRTWRQTSARAPRARASLRGTRRMTLNGLIFGAVWAAPILSMFNDVSEAQRVVLAAVASGMICGGALALATIWQALSFTR